MGYKYSPATAKLSAFMQKMEQTEKSPSMQKCFEGSCKNHFKGGSMTENFKGEKYKKSKNKPTVETESERFFDTTPGNVVEVSAFDSKGKIGPTVSSAGKTPKEFSQSMRKDYKGSDSMKKRAPKYQVEPETKEVGFERTRTKFGKKDDFGLRNERIQVKTKKTKMLGGDVTDLSVKKQKRDATSKSYKSYTTIPENALNTSAKLVSQKKIDRKLKQANRQLGRGTGKKIHN